MNGSYPIYLGIEAVGQAEVEKRGLYYHFFCQCKLTGEVIFRIVAETGETRENLGIPVPEGKHFSLKTRVPVSHFAQCEPVFRLVPRHPEVYEKAVPFSPQEPFAYLQKLEKAYLLHKDNELFIGFRD